MPGRERRTVFGLSAGQGRALLVYYFDPSLTFCPITFRESLIPIGYKGRFWQAFQEALNLHILCERCKATLVDPRLNIPVSDALEVDHRRRNIAVAHPLLQGANVDSVLQISCGICMTELVEKPPATVLAFSTAIDLHCSVFQFVRHDAMTAVQFSPIRDRL